ncbi:MAG: acyl-CoA thioesterase [Pseudomonadota bacterium]
MSDVFFQEFHVRWSDLDPNFHMRHTAYLDLCAATRFAYLETLGFDGPTFAKLRMGPIIFNENISYLKEVLPGDQVKVNVRMSALSEDGRKWEMKQEIFRVSDGELSAVLIISGAWFDLVKRKVSLPPDLLKSKIDQLPKTEDFRII